MAQSLPISSLPSGGVIQATDATVVVRGGLNYQVTVPVDLIYQNAATLLTKANIASPAFTGVPTAPTATAGTNTTQLATTAFVTNAVSLKANLASPAFTGIPTAPTATAGTNTTQLATTAFVASATTGVAPLASPAFTGVPTAPTATAGTNTTQLATTAFVISEVSSGGGIVASGTGWVRFTNGLIMQFFSANIVGGGVSNTITLPTSFTSTSYIPMITQGGVFNINPSGSDNDPQVVLGGFASNPPSGWSNSSFIVTAPHGSTSASSIKCAFFVIGY